MIRILGKSKNYNYVPPNNDGKPYSYESAPNGTVMSNLGSPVMSLSDAFSRDEFIGREFPEGSIDFEQSQQLDVGSKKNQSLRDRALVSAQETVAKVNGFFAEAKELDEGHQDSRRGEPGVYEHISDQSIFLTSRTVYTSADFKGDEQSLILLDHGTQGAHEYAYFQSNADGERAFGYRENGVTTEVLVAENGALTVFSDN